MRHRKRGHRRSAVFIRKIVLGSYRTGMGLSPKRSRFFWWSATSV